MKMKNCITKTILHLHASVAERKVLNQDFNTNPIHLMHFLATSIEEAIELLLIEEAKMEEKDQNVVPGLRLYLLKPLRTKTDADLK